MNRIDRAILICIGLGLWSFVCLHISGSTTVMAKKSESNHQHVPNDILQLEDFVWDVIPASCG